MCVCVCVCVIIFPLWTPTHGHSFVGQPAKSYIYRIRPDTSCRLDDLQSLTQRNHCYQSALMMMTMIMCVRTSVRIYIYIYIGRETE